MSIYTRLPLNACGSKPALFGPILLLRSGSASLWIQSALRENSRRAERKQQAGMEAAEERKEDSSAHHQEGRQKREVGSGEVRKEDIYILDSNV